MAKNGRYFGESLFWGHFRWVDGRVHVLSLRKTPTTTFPAGPAYCLVIGLLESRGTTRSLSIVNIPQKSSKCRTCPRMNLPVNRKAVFEQRV